MIPNEAVIPDEAATPLLDARENPMSAAIARSGLRKPLPFPEEAAIVERFLAAFNASDAARSLTGGPLVRVDLDLRGAGKSIVATNGTVTAAFEETNDRRFARVTQGGRTNRRTVSTGPDAVDFLAIELGGAC